MALILDKGGISTPATTPPLDDRQQAIAQKRAMSTAVTTAQDAETRRETVAANRDKTSRQTQAAAKTNASGKKLSTGVKTYSDKKTKFANKWAAGHKHAFRTQKEAENEFNKAWKNSAEGKAAEAELTQLALDYNANVQTELRIAVENSGSTDPATTKTVVNKTSTDIKARNQTGTIADPVLEQVVDRGSSRVAQESPAARRAALATTDAAEAWKKASENVQQFDNLPSLKGADPETRREIRRGLQPQIQAAYEQEAAAKAAFDRAVLNEAMTVLGTNGISTTPTGAKQYSDPTLFAAQQTVAENHPELYTNQEFQTTLAKVPGYAQLTANIGNLPAGKDTAPWVQKLFNDGDKTTAAFAVALGVDRAVPANEAEKILAEKDPLAFAILKYTGTPVSIAGAGADAQAPALTTDQYLQIAETAAGDGFNKLIKSDPTKAGYAQSMLFSMDDARVTAVDKEVRDLLGSETPSQSVDKIMDTYLEEKDFRNTGYQPDSNAARAMKVISVNSAATLSLEGGNRIWYAVGGSVESYLDAQLNDITSRYGNRDIYAASVGEWMKQMGQFAPTPAADFIANKAMQLDPALMGKMGGGRMVDGLKIVADRASPEMTATLGGWITSRDGEGAFAIPFGELTTVNKDGTGEALGRSVLQALDTRYPDKYDHSGLQQGFDASYNEALKNAGKAENKKVFDRFMNDRPQLLQDVFDNAVKNSGDLFTTKHKFGNDPVVDNEYGKAMGLTPDNPNAAPGQPLYTDPQKLAKIHEQKQNDWLGAGMGLETDNPNVPLGQPKYTDPEKLKQINLLRDHIIEIGGNNAEVTFTPAVYASPIAGVQMTYLVRVEGDKNNDGVITREQTTARTAGNGRGVITLKDEDQIIDASVIGQEAQGVNAQWKYEDFGDFQRDNQLDDKGKLFMANSPDMLLHTDGNGKVTNINFDGTDAAITTTWERVSVWGDRAAAVAGVVGGIALTVGTGGLAAPLLVGGAMAWGLYRTMETADNMQQHGQSFNPINVGGKGAWLGVIDPTAGGFWLNGVATASGIAAMRPLALGKAVVGLGRGATLADETALAGVGMSSNNLSRNITADLFRSEGLQTNLYRTQLGTTSRALSWTATGSGSAMMATQGVSFAQMAADGQIDLTDWSEMSSSWDLLMLGANVAPIAAGAAARRGYLPTAGVHQGVNPNDRVTLSAHATPEGTLSVEQMDSAFTGGRTWPDGAPTDIMIFETSAAADGAITGDNLHFFSRNRDGTYRVSNLRDGVVPGSFSLDGVLGREGAPSPWRQQPQQQHQQGPGADNTPSVNAPDGASPLPAARAAWSPSPDDQVLTVGGGHSFRPANQGEVFLNIDGNAGPDIHADVRSTPIPDEHFEQVFFENIPYDVLRDGSTLDESYRVLKPGGDLVIATGSNGVVGGDERAAIMHNLETAGFEAGDVYMAGHTVSPLELRGLAGGRGLILAHKPETADAATTPTRLQPTVNMDAPTVGTVEANTGGSADAGATANDRILSVGTGNALRNKNPDEVFLNIAPEANADITADIRDTGLPDASWSKVSLESLPANVLEDPRTASEVYRILQPGGPILIQTNARVASKDGLATIQENLRNAGFQHVGVGRTERPQEAGGSLYSIYGYKPENAGASATSVPVGRATPPRATTTAATQPTIVTAGGRPSQPSATQTNTQPTSRAAAPTATQPSTSTSRTQPTGPHTVQVPANATPATQPVSVVHATTPATPAHASPASSAASPAANAGGKKKLRARMAENNRKRFLARIERSANKVPTLDEHWNAMMGGRAALPATPDGVTVRDVALSEIIKEVNGHDAALRPEGSNRQSNPEFERAASRLMAGREAFLTSTGPYNAVNHPGNPSARKGTYRGDKAVDVRHLKALKRMDRNLRNWWRQMDKIVQSHQGQGLLSTLSRIDDAVFFGDAKELNAALTELKGKLPQDTLAKNKALIKNLEELAAKQPYQRLVAHLGCVYGNPALAATPERALNFLLDHYTEVTGAGDIVIRRDLSTQLMNGKTGKKGERFDARFSSHTLNLVKLLAIHDALGKPVMISSDLGNTAVNPENAFRPMATADHGYEWFNHTMDIIAPFTQRPGSGVILARTGLNQFIMPDTTPTTNTWGAINGVTYGKTLPTHIDIMEKMLERAPHLKLDISSNMDDFASNPVLLDALAAFIERHPDTVVFGSGARKPENAGQYHQSSEDFKPLLAELGARDPQLVEKVLYSNFEGVMDRSVRSLDPTDKQMVTGRLTELANALEGNVSPVPGAAEAKRLFMQYTPEIESGSMSRDFAASLRKYSAAVDRTVVNKDGVLMNERIRQGYSLQDGTQSITLRGRDMARKELRQELAAVDWDAAKAVMDAHPLTQTATSPDFSTAQWAPRSRNPKALLRAEAPERSGTAAGKDGAGTPAGIAADLSAKIASSTGVDASTALAGGLAFGLTYPQPGAILALAASRSLLNWFKLRERVFHRRLVDEFNEDAKVTDAVLNLLIDGYVKHGQEMGITAPQVAEVLYHAGQLRTNLRTIAEATKGWPEEMAQVRTNNQHRAIAAFEEKALMAMGLQPSALTINDPRFRSGRLQNSAYSMSQAATTGALAQKLPDTMVKIAELPIPDQAKITLEILAGGALVLNAGGALVRQRINHLGRRGDNPERHDFVARAEAVFPAGQTSAASAVGTRWGLEAVYADTFPERVGAGVVAAANAVDAVVSAHGGYRGLRRIFGFGNPKSPTTEKEDRRAGRASWFQTTLRGVGSLFK